MEPISLYDWIDVNEQMMKHKIKIKKINNHKIAKFNSISQPTERTIEALKNIKKIRNISNEYKFKSNEKESKSNSILFKNKLTELRNRNNIYVTDIKFLDVIKKHKDSLLYCRKLNDSQINNENQRFKERMKNV